MVNLEEHCELKSVISGSLVSTEGKEYIDWQDWASRQAWSQNHRLNIAGKTDKTNYYVSGGFSTNEGIIKQTGNSQADFRLNIDQDVSQTFKIGTKTGFTYRKLTMTQGSDSKAQSSSGLIRQMTSFSHTNPFQPILSM
jgi:hypothetical protein